MDDKELLELAAYAAGIDVKYFLIPWNPLTDDGDAFRLAVTIKHTVTPVYVFDGPWDNGGTLQDPYAATRRAIVRAAAAEIGKTL